MLDPLNDPPSWPALFADARAKQGAPDTADARLSEQLGARTGQRRRARAAIEFNARVPELARQYGIRPVRQKASGSPPDAWKERGR